MAKVPSRMRSALDRKVSKLAKAKRLTGKNLERVVERLDRLRGPTTTTTQVPRRPTTTTTLPIKPTKEDRLLMKQGFTAKELGLTGRKKK